MPLRDPAHARKLTMRSALLQSEANRRSCRSGAVYSRSESIALSRQIDSFACSACGATLETWNTSWVPSCRLVAGPVREACQINSRATDMFWAEIGISHFHCGRTRFHEAKLLCRAFDLVF